MSTGSKEVAELGKRRQIFKINRVLKTTALSFQLARVQVKEWNLLESRFLAWEIKLLNGFTR